MAGLSDEALARSAAEWLEPLLVGQDRAQPDLPPMNCSTP